LEKGAIKFKGSKLWNNLPTDGFYPDTLGWGGNSPNVCWDIGIWGNMLGSGAVPPWWWSQGAEPLDHQGIWEAECFAAKVANFGNS